MVLAAVLVAIVTLELVLQLAAAVHHRYFQTSELWVSEALGGPEYRILSLGESTTEGFDETPYPQLLAQALNRGQFNDSFRVMNAGYISKHTTDLADTLEDLIESYDPQMVIVMMGVNDQFYFHDLTAHGRAEEAQILLLRSKLYKLFRIAWSNLEDALYPSVDSQHLADYEREFDELYEAWSKWENRNPESAFLGLIQMAREATVLPDELATTTLDIRKEYLFNYLNLYDFLLEIYLSSDRLNDAIRLYEEAIETHPDTEYFYRGLAGIYAEAGDTERSAEYRELAGQLAVEKVLGVTVHNFQRVRHTLAEHGITFVAMQYPLRNVSALQAILDNAPEVMYVDNESTFRQQVGELGYETLFVDRFAGDFGHCSEAGNRLIVDNLLEQVFIKSFN